MRPDPEIPRSHVDLFADDVLDDPYPHLRAMRASQISYGMCNPLMLRATTSRWISEVPSKIV